MANDWIERDDFKVKKDKKETKRNRKKFKQALREFKNIKTPVDSEEFEEDEFDEYV